MARTRSPLGRLRSPFLPAFGLVAALALSCTQVDTATIATTTMDEEKIGTGEVVAEGRPITPFTGLLDLVPKWSKGDRVEYEIVKTRRRTAPGRPDLDTTARTPLVVEVAEASDAGYLLVLTYGVTTFDDPKMAENPILQAIASAFKDLRILVEIGPIGTVEGVRNWEEVKAAGERTLQRLEEGLRQSGADEKTLAAVRQTAGMIYATREQVERSATEHIGLLLLPIGFEYEGSTPVEYTDQLQMPVGGGAIPTMGRLTLLGYTSAPSAAIITFGQALSPEAARRAVEGSMREMAKGVGVDPPPQEDLLDEMKIRDAGEYAVDARSAWVERFVHRRTITAGPASQVELISIRRVR